jgi:hypothetical protein
MLPVLPCSDVTFCTNLVQPLFCLKEQPTQSTNQPRSRASTSSRAAWRPDCPPTPSSRPSAPAWQTGRPSSPRWPPSATATSGSATGG